MSCPSSLMARALAGPIALGLFAALTAVPRDAVAGPPPAAGAPLTRLGSDLRALPRQVQALSLDGGAVVAVTPHGLFRYDAQTGAALPAPVLPPLKGRRVSFLSGSGALVLVSGESELAVVDTRTGTIRARLKAPGSASAVAFSPDERHVVVGFGHGLAWHLALDRPDRAPRALAVTDTIITSAAFDGSRLAFGDLQGEIHLLGLDDSGPTRTIDAHASAVSALLFAGPTLLAGGFDDRLTAWDLAGGSLAWESRHFGGRIHRLAPLGSKEAFVTGANAMATVEIASGAITRVPRLSGCYLRAAARSVELLALACDDGELRLLAGAELTPIGPRAEPPGVVTGIVFAPDGRRLVSVQGPTVTLWDLAKREVVARYEVRGRELWRLVWRSEPYAVEVMTPVETVVLEATGLTALSRTEPPPYAHGPPRPEDPEFDRILAIAARPELSAALGGQSPRALTLALTPGDTHLVVGYPDGRIALWAVASGAHVHTFAGAHRGPVTSLAVSPAGDTLASGGADFTIALWDLRSHLPSP